MPRPEAKALEGSLDELVDMALEALEEPIRFLAGKPPVIDGGVEVLLRRGDDCLLEPVDGLALGAGDVGERATGPQPLVDLLAAEVEVVGGGRELVAQPVGAGEPNLSALGADFWYHALWAARKLPRGEVLTAKRTVDGYLKERLVTLLAWHAGAGDPELDTWHETRFFERWADPAAVEALRAAYARYDASEVGRAVQVTMDVFEHFERETALRLAFAPPPDRGPVRALVLEALGADDQG